MINVQFSGMDKGIYQIRLINSIGQVVFIHQLTHTGGSATQTVMLGNIAAGNYQLEITNPDNSKTVKPLIVGN